MRVKLSPRIFRSAPRIPKNNLAPDPAASKNRFLAAATFSSFLHVALDFDAGALGLHPSCPPHAHRLLHFLPHHIFIISPVHHLLDHARIIHREDPPPLHALLEEDIHALGY
jgi:hypothetical protein